MQKIYIVKLNTEEQERIVRILNRGRELASVRKRAQSLQLSSKGLSDEDVSQVSALSVSAIARLRKRYVEKGINKALYGEKRVGQKSPYDEKDEAVLVALACSDPPKGRSCWTLELLAQRMSKDTGKPIRKTTVGKLLKKTAANLGGRRCGALRR